MSNTLSRRFLILSSIAVLLYVGAMYAWIKHGYNGGTNSSIQYDSTLQEGIAFPRLGYPSFIQAFSGISRQEPWGRWTNANTGQTKLVFKDNLPKDFVLELTAFSYGPNADAPTQIWVGNQMRELVIARDKASLYRVEFTGVGDVKAIEIRPPHPIAPNQINPQSTDGRKLGLGLVDLKIISQ